MKKKLFSSKRISSFTRTCSFILLLCLLTAFPGIRPHTANAKDLTEKTGYVAFGDSIAAGYGLDGYSAEQTTAPADSYQAQVANFLKTESCNYAVTGDDSEACIRLLESGAADADLKHADVISLSIGSNDLLLPFIRIVMDFFQIDPDRIDEADFANGFTMPQLDASAIRNYYQQAQELIAILRDNETLHAQAQAFPEKLQTILSILHRKAPDAEIYLTNIYNPFHFVPLLKDLSQTYIDEINQAFSADASDYTLVDVHTPFRQEELTNVHLDISNPFTANADPHPSVKGHKVIADCFIQALKAKNAPGAASVASVTSAKKTKLTVKVKLPANADGCQIRYAAAKNGTYKTLGVTSSKTYKTNAGKLKSGKTYYIKVRGFRTVKGVTYYGPAGPTNKIKIK